MKFVTSKITLISPIGLALIAYAFFWACTLIPPAAYRSIMQEHNVMFLHIPSHLLVAACIAAFICGVKVTSNKKVISKHPASSKRTRSILIAAPIIGLSILNLFSITLLLQNNPNLLFGWLTDGRSAKMDLDATGAMTNALPALYASCWWGLWRLLERERISETREWLLRVVITIATCIALYSALVKVARYDLLPCVFGMAIVFLTHKYTTGKVRLAGSMASLAVIAAAIVALFLVMAWLRGGDEAAILSKNFAGYTVASYNRLAALLNGDINFPFAGTGVYAFKFLTFIPLLNRWIDFANLFGMPAKEDAWLSEFGAVAQSGLDGGYIWTSAFGYIYSDIGIFSLVYFMILGMISKITWRSILRGRALGLTLYPWISFSILFWAGDNFFAHSKLIVFIGTGIFLGIYEYLISKKFKH